jgi:hypothetical protein
VSKDLIEDGATFQELTEIPEFYGNIHQSHLVVRVRLRRGAEAAERSLAIAAATINVAEGRVTVGMVGLPSDDLTKQRSRLVKPVLGIEKVTERHPGAGIIRICGQDLAYSRLGLLQSANPP